MNRRNDDRVEVTVTCSKCGAARSSELAATGYPPPCSKCGVTEVTVHVSVSDHAVATESASLEATPADQDRGWKRRWDEAERELALILAPLTGVVDARAIHAARHRLHSFYVQTYHIKDAFIAEASITGVSKIKVEDAVTSDRDLALLADLANLDKHGNLKKRPRSGEKPIIVSVSATSGDKGPREWRLKLVIKHAGSDLDGLQLAQDATDAWRRTLVGWGLL